MKIEKRHIIQIAGWSLLVLCFIGMFIAGRMSRRAVVCESIDVAITDSLSNKFISKADITAILDSLYGRYIGVSIDSLDLNRIEDIIDSNSAVHKSQAYVTKKGVLKIEITQRKPVVRFITKDGGYYADAQGSIIPIQKNFSSRVHTVDGALPIPSRMEDAAEMDDPKQLKWFNGIIDLVNFMEGSDQWKDAIVQIHTLEDGSLVLIPRKGNERFLFGQPDHVAEKFERIGLYYTSIVPEKGKDCYKEINVAYKGQIVCK